MESQFNYLEDKNLRENFEYQNKILNDLTQEKIKNEEEIKLYKKKLLYYNININNPYFKVSETSTLSKNSLYESLIIYIKTLNIKHIFDLYENNYEIEEKNQKMYNSIKTNDIRTFSPSHIIIKEFKEYRKTFEDLLTDYDKRSKLYINPEVLYF